MGILCFFHEMALSRFFVAVLVAFVVLFSLSAGAAAEKVVKIKRVSQEGGSGAAVVSIGLEGLAGITDSRIAVSVHEQGVRRGSRVDFSRDNKKTMRIGIPVSPVMDTYIRVVFSSDEGRRVRHIPLIATN